MSDRLPSLPLFVDDYEGATTHLTLEEDGVYMRLLRLCWRTPRCTIPDDANWIMRRMRVDKETYDRLVKPIIDEFFKRSRGRIYQKRLLQEFVYAVDRQKKRSEAGKKGGRAKSPKNNDKGESNAKAMLKQTQSNAEAPSPAQPSSIREEEANASPSPARASKSGQPKGVRKAGVDHPMPTDWKPSLGPAAERMVASWPDGMLEREEFTFRNHAAANGRVAKDWDAAFRTWLGKADERITNGRSSPANGGHSPGRNHGGDKRTPLQQACDDVIFRPRPDDLGPPSEAAGRHDAGSGGGDRQLPLAGVAGQR